VKKLFVITIAFTVMFAIALIVTTLGSSSAVIPIVFLAYTNGASGEPLAIFALTNLHSRPIDYSVVTEVKDGSTWPYYGTGASNGVVAVLPHKWPPLFKVAPHRASTFTVAVRRDAYTAWRVSLMYQKTPTKRDDVAMAVRRFFYRRNMNALANRVPTERFKAYTVYSSEITN
jgi:hypothetical protein